MPGERKVRWGNSGNWELLWCQKCETPLEATWSDILEALPIAARGIAMIASYIPVYGTALSFIINTTVSLAEGESIDQSLLDGIGGALPGQPTSGMAFNMAVAIGKGERIDRIAIDALPLDKSVRDILKVADDVVFGIASGQNVTDVVYRTVHNTLPPEAQRGMDLARRVINGENIPEMVLSEAEQVVVDRVRTNAAGVLNAAKGQGAAAMSAAEAKVDAMFNQYAAEFGYQMALDRLSSDGRGWVQLGVTGGASLRASTQFIGTFGTIPESNKPVNDSYEAKGKRLIASGIKYRTRLVSDILKGTTFSIVIDFFNSLNSVWTKRGMKYTITDAWRRGFTIAIGVCEGSSERGPGQLAVYQTLAEEGGRAGFDAGQAVQFQPHALWRPRHTAGRRCLAADAERTDAGRRCQARQGQIAEAPASVMRAGFLGLSAGTAAAAVEVRARSFDGAGDRSWTITEGENHGSRRTSGPPAETRIGGPQAQCRQAVAGYRRAVRPDHRYSQLPPCHTADTAVRLGRYFGNGAQFLAGFAGSVRHRSRRAGEGRRDRQARQAG